MYIDIGKAAIAAKILQKTLQVVFKLFFRHFKPF